MSKPRNRRAGARGGIITDAYMTVTNLLTDDLRLTVSHAVAMDNAFPDQQVAPGASSASSYVAASLTPGQSSFSLTYSVGGKDTEELAVQVGRAPFVTDVTYGPDGGAGGAGAILAPMPGSGADYAFLFYAGAKHVQTCANSIIGANLAAIAAWIDQNPIAIALGDNATLTITSLGLTSDDAACRFATFYPDGAGFPGSAGDPNWQLTAIFDLTASLSGTLSWASLSTQVTVSVEDLSLLIQASCDFTDPLHPSGTLTRLACSLGGFGISSALTDLIEALFPALHLALTGPYNLAGALNTKFNQAIIDAVNAWIARRLESRSLARVLALIRSPGAAPAHPASLIRRSRPARRLRSAGRPADQVRDYSTWMSTPSIQAKTLTELTIPGTRDSATYSLEPVLSSIKYPGIKHLWQLTPGQAPADGSWPFPSLDDENNVWHLGPDLMACVLDTAVRVSTAQAGDLTQQLNDGIRFFDLRIYHDDDGGFYAQHGVRGPRLEELLAGVRSFIDDHQTAAELIFLQISHTNFSGDQPARLAQMINDYLGDHIYLPPESKAAANFSFRHLADLTVGEITAGGPRVIVTDPDNVYPDTVVNTEGFATAGRNGTDSLVKLEAGEGTGLTENIEPLYEVAWTLAPQPKDIGRNALRALSGCLPAFPLAELAAEANSALASFLDEHAGHKANLVTLDWYGLSQGTSPVEAIISLNDVPAAVTAAA